MNSATCHCPVVVANSSIERYTPIKLKLINTHDSSKLSNKYDSFLRVYWRLTRPSATGGYWEFPGILNLQKLLCKTQASPYIFLPARWIMILPTPLLLYRIQACEDNRNNHPS